ncbi:hypothetical protein USDA257_c54830 [Sinorhizobium fredii USDA 257]|uniref:Uncharacterized protein n=1 Tax=Sinorhizobium fredii (strain USDA 257) TaxID=1185652 RepID=I3XDP2_SINF2|nr:hypothetical protein USDA257_c54830 [Sinorhizobium fredii USDA 257]
MLSAYRCFSSGFHRMNSFVATSERSGTSTGYSVKIQRVDRRPGARFFH